MPASQESRLVSLGMKLAVPYNHDPHLFTCLELRASSLAEIFVPAPLDVSGTFRPWNGPDPAEYRRSIPDIVRRARRIGVDVNMAINAPFVPLADHPMVVDYIGTASEQGVASFTIGDLHLAEAVRARFPGLQLVASATADIGNVTRARHWIMRAGVQRIVPSRLVNKDFRLLRAFAKLGVVIELIPNEQCLPSCPYVFSHAMTIGMRDTVDEQDFRAYSAICTGLKGLAPWEHWQTEIVPASVPRYRGLTTLIKLAGRDSTTSYIVGEVDRFIAVVDDSTGFLGGYREPSDVLDRVSACDRVCEKCGWCRERFTSVNPDWQSRIEVWRGLRS